MDYREFLTMLSEVLRKQDIQSEINDEIIRTLNEHSSNFDKIFSKLDEHSALFDVINNRLDNIDVRFDNMDICFDNMDIRFDNMYARLDRLEGKINGYSDVFKLILTTLSRHSDQFVEQQKFNNILLKEVRGLKINRKGQQR